jgi:superfamily II DNA or RNA helicase
MNSNYGFIYIRCHQSYDLYNACKLGITTNIPERDSHYATGEVKRGYFISVYKIKNIRMIERLLQYEFIKYNIKYDAGIEFYNKKIIDLIEPYLNKLNLEYIKLSIDEINNLTRCNRIKDIIKKINIKLLIKKLKEYNNIWKIRSYQSKIIKYSIDKLLTEYKIYIELSTGGGKTFIVYNLFQLLNSDFIIIISPRKIINLQNISSKYIKLLTDNYKIFNYSNDSNIDDFLKLSSKKIIICCTQSINKLYDLILSNNIKNITIWFDEAHIGIENWINNLNTQSKFWLLDNTNIKYRIFTSASPNHNIVFNNENIFGKLYIPIKIKELINLKWLSPINI